MELVKEAQVSETKPLPCLACHQTNTGQTGQYPCPACDLPLIWDGDPRTIPGPKGQPVPLNLKSLTLGIEKFKRPNKHYRLIWLLGSLAWPCLLHPEPIPEQPPQQRYSKVYGGGGVIEAGRKLAGVLGVKFSETVR